MIDSILNLNPVLLSLLILFFYSLLINFLYGHQTYWKISPSKYIKLFKKKRFFSSTSIFSSFFSLLSISFYSLSSFPSSLTSVFHSSNPFTSTSSSFTISSSSSFISIKYFIFPFYYNLKFTF